MGNDDIETKRALPKESISGALWTQFGKSGHLRVLTKPPKDNEKQDSKLPAALRFDGFPPSDYDSLNEVFNSMYGVALKRHSMSSAGYSWGNTDISNKHLVFRQCRLEDADEEGEEFEPQDGEEMTSLDLGEVSQCVLPGNNRNEIEMQFLESDTVEAGTDQLVAIRFYVPPDADADPTDKDAPTSAEVLQSHIMNIASVKKTSGSIIAEFDENKGTFLTPRGRYSIELYDSFLRMRGAKYDYKIKYDDISRLFLLPKQDDMHMAFVIALDKPVRQGQQRYNMLVMQCTKEHSELTINLDEETLKNEYDGALQEQMSGSFSNLVAKTFKIITKKKVFIPGKFANSNQQACVKCALRANEGHLYPLEKQFIFIHKPAVLIRFDEIESVEFQRYAGGQVTTRNFDLCVTLHHTPGDNNATKEYIFSGIDKTNYNAMFAFLSGKKIKIKNIQEAGMEEPSPTGRGGPTNYDEMDGGDSDESSEDEDYAQGKQSESEDMSGSDSEDDDDLGSVASDDSDLAEHRKDAKKDKKAKKPKSSKEKEPKSKKRKESPTKKKKKKDPNAPKNAKSAFMFFSVAKRAGIKEANPDASFGDMGKLVGAAWKEVDDKTKWEEMAAEDKQRYKKDMAAYSPPSEDDVSSDDDGNKKPKKKRAKKDPNAPKNAKSAFMFFSSAKRAGIKEANPDASFGDMGKLVGAAWKEVDDKTKWEELAAEDKQRYKKEMAAYTPKESEKKTKTKKKKEEKKEPSSSEEESSSDDSSDDSNDSDSD